MGERPASRWFFCVLVLTATMSAAGSQRLPLFDWTVPPETIKPGLEQVYVPVPGLSDATASVVDTFLANRLKADSNATLAVKVQSDLSSPSAKGIFDKYKINYVFADLESADAV